MTCINLGPFYNVTCVPEYSLTPLATSVNEGSTVRINISTTNVPPSTRLFYTIVADTPAIDNNDALYPFGVNELPAVIGNWLSSNRADGSFLPYIDVTAIADHKTEGVERFRVMLSTRGCSKISHPVVAISDPITINDTSIDPEDPGGPPGVETEWWDSTYVFEHEGKYVQVKQWRTTNVTPKINWLEVYFYNTPDTSTDPFWTASFSVPSEGFVGFNTGENWNSHGYLDTNEMFFAYRPGTEATYDKDVIYIFKVNSSNVTLFDKLPLDLMEVPEYSDCHGIGWLPLITEYGFFMNLYDLSIGTGWDYEKCESSVCDIYRP